MVDPWFSEETPTTLDRQKESHGTFWEPRVLVGPDLFGSGWFLFRT